MFETTLSEIKPVVRFIGELELPNNLKRRKIITYDHRLFYIAKGSGKFIIKNTEHSVSAGSLVYLMSGTPYAIYPDGKENLRLICVNFDFLQDDTGDTPYIKLSTPSQFDPSLRTEIVNFTDFDALNSPIVLSNMISVYAYLKSAIDEYEQRRDFWKIQLSNLLSIVFNLICRTLTNTHETKNSKKINKIIDYIHAHYNEELDNKKLAEIINYHPNYISQFIKKHTGVSLHQYLLNVRIRQAVLLLETTDLPISQIAAQVGFIDSSYFSQYFKKSTGHSPKEFRI